MFSPGWRRKLLVTVSVLVALGAAAAVVLLNAPGNESHPGVEFTNPASGQPATTPQVFSWPRYGYDAGRTRYFPSGHRLDPPFRTGWQFQDYALLEFPPVIYGNTLFLVDDNGSAKAIDKRTGGKLWETKVGTLAAASPALDTAHGLVFIPVLSANSSAGSNQAPGNGQLIALSMQAGRKVWAHAVPPGTESSPLAWAGAVYFGDQNGTVYSLRTRDGHVNWTYQAHGAVKGGPSLADGKLFFGDYSGHAYALDAKTGRQIWAVGTSGNALGFGSGNFYSSPAIAYGRVYMGNTDDRVYSFAESNGQLAWATSTNAYVYASPAVASVAGLGPTVYLGSYDGTFYAFDARSGAIRWKHAARGRISGSATIVGGVVYYSDLGSRTSTGLDARTGAQTFSFPDGAFNPVVADPTTIYLSGYSVLYQLLPRHGGTASGRGTSSK